MSFCECKLDVSINLAESFCDTVLKQSETILFKTKLNANGVDAFLPLGAAGAKDASFWATYLQASPLQNRYLVAKGVDDEEFEEQEAETVETSSGREFKLRDGVIEITQHFYGDKAKGASTKLYENFKKLECLELGINIIDVEGTIFGVEKGENMLLIPIDSLRVRYAKRTDSVMNHIIVTYRIPANFNFGSVRGWRPNTGDVPLLSLRGTVGVVGSDLAGADGSSTLTFKLGLESSKFGFDPFEGAEIVNVPVTVNGTPNVVTALTESPEGNYSATLTTALATGQSVEVNLVAAGFEMKPLKLTVA